ncbi:MAG: hypothetical protein OQK19_05740 [Sedimenticola sp.]|uniref:Uncharacterized protein n=1 Tax=Sedimenticola thiotaurini TaxID=1543721 RepID=A0A558DBV7_9GAMM|nr:hypothetical protein [Sedimenticola sp.]MCW8881559.1 hypothetical protein [Sedimenticola sp.]MCW8946140.1 hypothetical protein [Sedimenticola sp.]TVT58512.1 MAG: hypothetical protein FHK82_03840 [Sedimenticola thiotaurini]
MLEYIFFDERPWQLFIDYLTARGLQPLSAQEDQGFMVRLPEDTDDALMDDIEAYYDEMLDMNEALFIEQADPSEHKHAAGVSVNLSDGRTVQAVVDPALLNRILDVLSTDELGQFINSIVDAVENPDERSVCRRM